MDLASIRKTYRRYASGYDLYFGLILNDGRRRTVEKMACLSGEKILEVGVGTGLSLPLYPRCVEVAGIDVSREMLEKARKLRNRLRLDNVVQLDEMDAEEMTFADNTFDRVAAMYVASVVPNPRRLVDEMRRVCRPGGQLYVVNHFRTNGPMAKIEELLAPFSGTLGFHPDFSLDTFIAETGIEVAEAMPVNAFGFWTLLTIPNEKERALSS